MMLPINNPGEGGGSGSGGITSGSESPNIAGKNLREGNNITLRPLVLTSRHLYNLRNQGWAPPRPSFGGDNNNIDLISNFINASGGPYPANADTTTAFIYANTNSNSSKYIVRFNAQDCVSNPMGTSLAPMGYFIIDALDRGTSRMSAYAQMMTQYPSNNINIDSLPLDQTPSGATVVAEYGGRIFYSGFTGELNDGDSNSPKMSSYVLFSTLIQASQDAFSCYQSADPTSKDQSDLIDTDGGFIRLEGAYNICAMQNIQTGLVVFAENGIWVISGATGSGFTATGYQVIKVSTSGCTSPGSVVTVNNEAFYWSRDGIYSVTVNQFGNFIAENITRKTIKTLYNNISADDIQKVQGVYDEYEQRVKWFFGNRYSSTINPTELILDVISGAYTKYVIQQVGGAKYPMTLGGANVNPYAQNTGYDDVVDAAGDLVIDAAGDQVEVIDTTSDVLSNTKEVQYIAITSISPTIKFTFGNYTNPNHYDWVSYNGTGVDAPSYLLTGAITGGDTQRVKGIHYITAHFNQTETGLVDDGTGSGDYKLVNPSSCMLQAQWDWTNNVNSNRWTVPQQVYRLRRAYYPSSTDVFDNGFSVVETKTKLRGSGKAVSFLFTSSPNYHMELLGWATSQGANGNV